MLNGLLSSPCHSFFPLLCFSWVIYTDLSSSSFSSFIHSLAMSSLTDKNTTGILHFCFEPLIADIFIWFILKTPSLSRNCTSVLICCHFSTGVFSILIIIILIPLSDISNICIISEADSVDSFVSWQCVAICLLLLVSPCRVSIFSLPSKVSWLPCDFNPLTVQENLWIYIYLQDFCCCCYYKGENNTLSSFLHPCRN